MYRKGMSKRNQPTPGIAHWLFRQNGDTYNGPEQPFVCAALHRVIRVLGIYWLQSQVSRAQQTMATQRP